MDSTGKRHFFIVIMLSCLLYPIISFAQFSPAPPNSNTSAIHVNDASFSFWADDVSLEKGWQDIADTTLGKVSVGSENSAIGKASNLIVSLGDSGVATLSFPFPIYNISGYDFAVFENGFAEENSLPNEFFLELAYVSVSENGIDFIPFESTSYTDTSTAIGSFGRIDVTKINNLAGKYPKNYGTPFDLEEIGLDSIVSIKIVDVIGNISDTISSSFDSFGNKINDPYPTGFPSGGFDLNAVGAINQPNVIIENSIHQISKSNAPKIYPNPVLKNGIVKIETQLVGKNEIIIRNNLGKLILKKKIEKSCFIDTKGFLSGIYFIQVSDEQLINTSKLILK